MNKQPNALEILDLRRYGGSYSFLQTEGAALFQTGIIYNFAWFWKQRTDIQQWA